MVNFSFFSYFFNVCVATNTAHFIASSLSYFSTDAKVWDMIAELVAICTNPSPPNPFAVDFDYFEALPSTERVLATAAMLSLLRSILASGTHRYDRKGTSCSSMTLIFLIVFFSLEYFGKQLCLCLLLLLSLRCSRLPLPSMIATLVLVSDL